MNPLDPHLRRALRFVRPYVGALVPVVLLSLLGTALNLVLPYLSKLLVDDAIIPGDFGALVRLVAVFVGITVLSFALNVFSGMRYTRGSADILFDMRLDLYRHLQRLSPRYYAKTPLGDVVSRINGDIGEIQRVTAEAALAWFGQVVALVTTVVMLLVLDWQLFLVGLATLPPALWALLRYRRQLEDRLLVAEPGETVEIAVRGTSGTRSVRVSLDTSPWIVAGREGELVDALTWARLVLLDETTDPRERWVIRLDQALLQLRAGDPEGAVRQLRNVEAPQTSHGVGRATVDYWLGIALSRLGPRFRDAAVEALQRAAAVPGARLDHDDDAWVAPRAEARLHALRTGH